MAFTAPKSFDRSVERIEGMMRQGTAFERVEDAIDRAGFSPDHRAALWLVAWSLRDQQHRRGDASRAGHA